MTHDEHQYRYSRSHATAELLAAIRGDGPATDDRRKFFGPTREESDVPCGETFRYASRVYAFGAAPGYDVTCPVCRMAMRLVRPESAPKHEVAHGRGYVGGEQMNMDEYEARIS